MPSLKMKPQHYQEIKDKIGSIAPKDVTYLKNIIWEAQTFKNFERRILWELCYWKIPSAWICSELYPYLDDSHIESALKQIIKELKIDISIPSKEATHAKTYQ